MRITTTTRRPPADRREQCNVMCTGLVLAYLVPGAIRRAAVQSAHEAGWSLVLACIAVGAWAAWVAPTLGSADATERASFVMLRCGALLFSSTPPALEIPLCGPLHWVGMLMLAVSSVHASCRITGSGRLLYGAVAWAALGLLCLSTVDSTLRWAAEHAAATLVMGAPLGMRALMS
jgi:hypothetical protein